MNNFLLANAKDLEFWAKRIDARSFLPKLIRRLIFATAEQIVRLHFRADEGVQSGGWDGIAEVQGGNAFIPQGISVFELSTRSDIKRKAGEDYAKRTKNSLGFSQRNITFIFITPRRWAEKEKWVQEKRGEGKWKDVRVYDADDLETWLEQAPAVHIWLSALVGKRPVGVHNLESFWDAWSNATQPPLIPDLLTAGRGKEVLRIHQWISGEPSILGVQADTREEAVAFFFAAMLQLPETQRESHMTRAVLVEDASAWSPLVAREVPLILVPTFSNRQSDAEAISRGHYVLVPLDIGEPRLKNAFPLPRQRRNEIQKALKKMGFREDKAMEHASAVRRSLSAFRRELARDPGVLIPDWIKSEKLDQARWLIPALLAGSWREDNDFDCRTLANLAGLKYSDLRNTLLKLTQVPDPPLRLVGSTWIVAAPKDTWTLLLLSDYLSSILIHDFLNKFEEVALEVLGEYDSQFELPEGERWSAYLLEKVHKHSESIRQGIADTLALMVAFSDKTKNQIGLSLRDSAKRIVNKLFLDQVPKWTLWASISPFLSRLAEATPDIFLESVDRDLLQPEPALLNLFTDRDGSSFWESSPHVGLLWGLEVLAWSPNYLSSAALLLAKLAKLDPGGRLFNRPINSLRNIFLAWHPCTTADLVQRLTVLDLLRKREPEIAWKVLLSILPRSNVIVSSTAEPKWRDWVSDFESEITPDVIDKSTAEIVRRLLEDVGNDGSRWADLIGTLGDLPESEFRAVVDALLDLNLADLSQNNRYFIWDALRKLISRHLQFPGAEWALPQKATERLQEAYGRFEPEDLLLKWTWLFSNQPDLPEGGYADWQQREQAIEQKRIQAVEEIFEQGCLQTLFELAERVENPFKVGIALGRSNFPSCEEENLLDWILGSSQYALRQMAFGFLYGRISLKGLDWLNSLPAWSKWQEWSARKRADYFLCLPFNFSTWNLLAKESQETQNLYWSEVDIYGKGKDRLTPEECKVVLQKLKEYGRLRSAVEFCALCIHHWKIPIHPQLVAEVLEKIILGESREEIKQNIILPVAIGELLEFLYNSSEIEEARVARLEWFFLPLLRSCDFKPKLLEKTLAEDPGFFVKVLILLYRAEGEEPIEPAEEQKIRAHLGRDLLSHWQTPPGVNADESVDLEKLKFWVHRVCKLAYQVGLEKKAEIHTGLVLAYYPDGTDGAWPHEALRDLLEELKNYEIEKGIEIGILKSRSSTRVAAEGETPERSLADRYRNFVAVVRDKWPRTARLLERVADDYEHKANWWDIINELIEYRM